MWKIDTIGHTCMLSIVVYFTLTVYESSGIPIDKQEATAVEDKPVKENVDFNKSLKSAALANINTLPTEIKSELLKLSVKKRDEVNQSKPLEDSLKIRVKRWGANWIARSMYSRDYHRSRLRTTTEKSSEIDFAYDNLGGGIWG